MYKPEGEDSPLVINELWVEIHLGHLYHECNRRKCSV